jgi:hypothetical protein
MEDINKIAVDKRLKIKSDYKTTITVGSIDDYKMWKDTYPEAILVE